MMNRTHDRWRGKAALALQLLLLLAIMAIHFPMSGPHQVATGRVAIKLWMIVRICLVLGLASWFLHLRGLGWSDVGLRRPNWWRMAAAIPLGLVAALVLVGGVNRLLAKAGVALPDYSAFDGIRGNLGEYLFWGFAVAWGAAGFGEELLFRGFAMDALERIWPHGRGAAGFAIVGQAVLFSALHGYQGWGGAIMTGTLGLVLGLVWLWSGRNLWAGIIAHGLIDCSSMTSIYLAVHR